MRIAVLGSHRDEMGGPRPILPTQSKEQFVEACVTLGRSLAEAGHRLVVAHPADDDTADFHVLRGFREIDSSNYEECWDHTDEPWLKAHFDAVQRSNAIVLLGGADGTYAAGLAALRQRCLIVPITAFGGSARELCSIPEIDGQLIDEIRNIDLLKSDWAQALSNAVLAVLQSYPRVLIIHGRGDGGHELQAMFTQASLKPGGHLEGIATPVLMNLSGAGATSVPAHFEKLASKVGAAIAIVTADDVGGHARQSDGSSMRGLDLVLTQRARENVWVEVGWFWGRLGRERVQIWQKDRIDLPSDLQGVANVRGAKLADAWPGIENFIRSLRTGSNPFAD